MKIALKTKQAAGFTMLEIALSLAVIGFAVVAIIGILPMSLEVQKNNRESTIVSQDATVFLTAMRGGDLSLDDLTNYLVKIEIDRSYYDAAGKKIAGGGLYTYAYTSNSSLVSVAAPLATNGLHILGLLTTPRLVPDGNGYQSNYVSAVFRSISGPAEEKPPQKDANSQDFAFAYRMIPEIMNQGTNYYDGVWTNYIGLATNSIDYANAHTAWLNARNLNANLHDLKLTFRWPLLPDLTYVNTRKAGRQVYRCLVAGQLLATNDWGMTGLDSMLYYFESQHFTNATPRIQ